MRFVRTADGRGVVVMREGGKGEGWMVRDVKGKGTRLERAGKWSGEADLVVVLESGQYLLSSTVFSDADANALVLTQEKV